MLCNIILNEYLVLENRFTLSLMSRLVIAMDLTKVKTELNIMTVTCALIPK